MAIYSGFSHKKMVIFHSYVSLPEGSQKLVCESHEHPGTSSLVHDYPLFTSINPRLRQVMSTGTISANSGVHERIESDRFEPRSLRWRAAGVGKMGAQVKDGCHKSMCFFCSNAPTKIVGLARIQWRTWPVKKWPLRYLQIDQYNPVNTIWYGSNWINHGGFAWRLR